MNKQKNYIDEVLEEFNEKFKCIQSNCDNFGTINCGGEPNQCQFCDEYLIPQREFLKQKLREAEQNEKERIIEIVENIDYYNSKNVMVDIINKIKELK